MEGQGLEVFEMIGERGLKEIGTKINTENCQNMGQRWVHFGWCEDMPIFWFWEGEEGVLNNLSDAKWLGNLC